MTKSKEYLSNFYSQLSRREKHWIFRMIDCVSIVLSLYFAFVFRFDLFSVGKIINQYLDLVYIVIPLKLTFFWLSGLYRPVVKYLGFDFFTTAMVASFGGTASLALLSFILRFQSFPRSVYLLDALITLFFLVFTRYAVRWVGNNIIGHSAVKDSVERVLIYGAGEIGSQLATALERQQQFKVFGFIDDDPQLQKHIIGGVKVHAPFEIKALSIKNDIGSVLLAIPSATKEQRIKIIDTIRLHNAKLEIKTIPAMSDIISGKVEINTIRRIDITDLLGRDEIEPVEALLRTNSFGRSVMVTGAGGSIGSELCRQILLEKPKRLVLYERNEFALYKIDLELRERFPDAEIIPCLNSVIDQSRLEEIIRQNNVEIIYHAAAYKHVPLVELNAPEGIINNVLGTFACAQAAINCHIETFVLISTDKAVRPTNVMGTTKRVAEMTLQALSREKNHQTRLIMVRFGNVLGSAGSVVPRFRKQIAEGGPITVTHRDITRYFMSIPEASRLVIQAGAMGKGGEVFLLDMGTPVRICDLATQMISLSGLRYPDDIDITFTGLRPGEKLYEELLIDTRNSEKTDHPKIFKANERYLPFSELGHLLDELKEAAERYDRSACISMLQKIVPEFQPGTMGEKSKVVGAVIPFRKVDVN